MQHIYNEQRVALHDYEIADVVLNMLVVQQRSGAVVRMFGSQPKGPWIENTCRYLSHVV